MSSNNNILNKTGLTYLWSKIVTYINNVFPAIIGDTPMGTTADTITGAIAEHQQDIRDLNSKNNSINITSATRISTTVTTGSTGNIALGLNNDGYTFVVAPHTSGSNVFLRAWVSGSNNTWYLTAINPNTGDTINNTSLSIRYLRVYIKSM